MMDDTPVEPGDVVIYIESSLCMIKAAQVCDVSDLNASSAPKNADEVSLSLEIKNTGGYPMDAADEKPKKGKCVSQNSKKPPKPPRPPKGLLCVDAADKKLISEIAEITKVKRARIERRKKALEKMKAAKTSSSSISSIGNWIATLFTILFCIVIIFQGWLPRESHAGTYQPPTEEQKTLPVF